MVKLEFLLSCAQRKKGAQTPWANVFSANLFVASALTAGSALVIPAGAAQAQVQVPPQISPPSRSELTPPELRREDRPDVTLTIDGDLERSPCVLDRAEYADIKLTLNGVEFSGLERAPGRHASAHSGSVKHGIVVSLSAAGRTN